MRVIHNPKCSKCREMVKFLNEKGISFEEIFYLETGITKELLEEIVEKAKLKITDLIRTGEEEYKEFKEKNLSDDEWLDVVVNNPKLLQRPIVIKGDSAIVGRPLENVLPLL